MNIPEITKRVKELPSHQLESLKTWLSLMLNQIQVSLSLRTPFTILLDSNILMRVEDFENDKNVEKFLAIAIAIEVTKKLDYFFDYALLPTVFFEFCRKQQPSGVSGHWSAYTKAVHPVEKYLDIQLLNVGFGNESESTEVLHAIEHDSRLLISVLKTYEQLDWRKVALRMVRRTAVGSVRFELLPDAIASNLGKRYDLDYFDPLAVEFYLFHLRLFHICKIQNKVPGVFYGPDLFASFGKVLGLRNNGSIEGLADLDLFLKTNMRSQFQRQSFGQLWHAMICMSLDTNLNVLLGEFGNARITAQFKFGPNADLDHLATSEKYRFELQRFAEAEVRMKHYQEIVTEVTECVFARA